MTIRALVVDDSELVVGAVSKILTDELGFEVVGTAGNGLVAVDMADAVRPDLMTLDVRMPVMDGLRALRYIMVRRPVPTVMISAFTQDDSHLTFDCLRCGALDFVPKPTGDRPRSLAESRRLIADRLRKAASLEAPPPAYCRLIEPVADSRGTASADAEPLPAHRVVLISGGRTGLSALFQILNAFSSDLEAAVVVSLGVGHEVLGSLARYLERVTFLPVVAARQEQSLIGGRVHLVSSFEQWLLVEADSASDGGPELALRGVEAPAESLPTVHQGGLISSVAELCNEAAVLVLLSGAPGSVLEGVEQIRSCGGHAVVQTAESALDSRTLVEAGRRRMATAVVEPSALGSRIIETLAAVGGS